jgi:predicted MPP superfamily phosphohydrolase
LPIYGPVFKRTNAKNFVNGRHDLDQSTLLISNGLGLESSHRFRLFTTNEVLSISLTGTKQEDQEEIPIDPQNEEPDVTQ